MAKDVFENLLEVIAEKWRYEALTAKARPYSLKFTLMSSVIAVQQTKFTNDPGDFYPNKACLYDYQDESVEP